MPTAPIAQRSPKQVGDDAGQQRPDGVPAVAPEPVDPDRRGPPFRVGDVADRRQERWVDHCRAQPEEHRTHGPRDEPGVATMMKMPRAWMSMPPVISGLRPM